MVPIWLKCKNENLLESVVLQHFEKCIELSLDIRVSLYTSWGVWTLQREKIGEQEYKEWFCLQCKHFNQKPIRAKGDWDLSIDV